MKRRKIEMGIYCYTLRKNTIKAIDMDIVVPIEIGVTKYAYKESSSLSAEYRRMVGRAHAAAERARDANPNLVLVTFGDPKEHNFDTDGNMTVYRCSPVLEYFMDHKAPGEAFGYLYKEDKKLKFKRLVS